MRHTSTVGAAFLMLVCLWAFPLSAEQKLARLTSLHWPPYTIANSGTGLTDETVRKAFAAVGWQVETVYMPWSEAVARVRDGGADGVYPEYRSAERDTECVMSPAIGESPLGFAERQRSPIAWNRLEDIRTKRIGVVSDYVNEETFDTMVREGHLKVDESPSDALALRKLAMGRLDLVVIDRNVFRYLLDSDTILRPLAGQMHFNNKLLESKSLHICFRDDPQGRAAAAAFTAGLKELRITNR